MLIGNGNVAGVSDVVDVLKKNGIIPIVFEPIIQA